MPGRVSLSGSLLTDGNRESALQDTSAYALRLTLEDDYWSPVLAPNASSSSDASPAAAAAAAFDAVALALFSGISSANGSVAAGAAGASWDSVVRANLAPRSLAYIDNQTIEISVPQSSAYDIAMPETVAVQVPAPAVASGGDVSNAPSFAVWADRGRAALFGSLLPALTESALKSAEHILTIRLYNDLFSPELGVDGSSATAALLSVLASSQSEPGGFNAIIRPTISAAHVERQSDTEVDVRIPAAGVLYVINYPETIHLSLPAATVQSGQSIDLVDPASLIIRADPGLVTLAGGEDDDACGGSGQRCVLTMAEGVLVAGVSYYTFTYTLSAEAAWLPVLDAPTLLSGLVSLQSEPSGFNAVIMPLLHACYGATTSCPAGSLTGLSVVQKISSQTVNLKIGKAPNYAITVFFSALPPLFSIHPRLSTSLALFKTAFSHALSHVFSHAPPPPCLSCCRVSSSGA